MNIMINEGQEYLNVDRPLRLRNRLPLWSLPSPYRCWTKHGHPIYMAHSIEGSLDLKLSTNSSFKVAGLHEYATVSYVYRCVRSEYPTILSTHLASQLWSPKAQLRPSETVLYLSACQSLITWNPSLYFQTQNRSSPPAPNDRNFLARYSGLFFVR